MAGFYFETKLRPCYVGERPALFHCWTHEQQVTGGEGTMAIVEYEDGEVELVYPRWVRFIDNKFLDYSWEEKDQ